MTKVKEGAVIRDGFNVTNVESWTSGKGISRTSKAANDDQKLKFWLTKGGVRVEGEGGGQSGVSESYTAQSVVI